MRSFHKKFSRNEDGSVFIEFAFIAPVLFLVMFAIVEYGLIMFATNVVENGTSNASRLGKTGYTEAGTSRQDLIHSMVKEASAGFLDTNKVTINTKVYQTLDKIGDPEPYTDANHNGKYDVGETYSDINTNGQWDQDMGVAGLGNAGDVVVYTVNYPWEVLTPILSSLIGAQGVYTITSTMVVRNEPYNLGGR